jgi:hypothetical protein
MSLTTSSEAYSFKADRGFADDLRTIAKDDQNASVGLTFLIQEIRDDPALLRVLQQQTSQPFALKIGTLNCCEIREFRVTGGRLVWRIKPITSLLGWHGYETTGNYRIFYSPDVLRREIVFLCAALRVGSMGDIYAPGHRVHQRICDRYDRCGLRAWGRG